MPRREREHHRPASSRELLELHRLLRERISWPVGGPVTLRTCPPLCGSLPASAPPPVGTLGQHSIFMSPDPFLLSTRPSVVQAIDVDQRGAGEQQAQSYACLACSVAGALHPTLDGNLVRCLSHSPPLLLTGPTALRFPPDRRRVGVTSWRVHAWVLMGNRYHLFSRTLKRT